MARPSSCRPADKQSGAASQGRRHLAVPAVSQAGRPGSLGTEGRAVQCPRGWHSPHLSTKEVGAAPVEKVKQLLWAREMPW